jgi:hypothetical protein
MDNNARFGKSQRFFYYFKIASPFVRGFSLRERAILGLVATFSETPRKT